MTKNFKPEAWFLPQPVMIIGTYDADGTPNAMNAAWGGQWDYKEVTALSFKIVLHGWKCCYFIADIRVSLPPV